MHYFYRPVQLWVRRLTVSVLSGGISILQLSTPGVSQTSPEKLLKTVTNVATYRYDDPSGQSFAGKTNQLTQSLADPLGQITGCNGELLSDYQGFSVGVYNTDAIGLDLAGLVPLTQTEVPDIPGNGISGGLAPNAQNRNPYFIQSDGTYNFILDESQGQLTVGKSYILVVNPPTNSTYAQRRIKLTITNINGKTIAYTATALDGKPINTSNGVTSVNGTLTVEDAERVGLSLAVVNIAVNVCDAQEIQITKSGDRATAIPGDTVIYRLSVRNLSSANLNNVTVRDTLPLGFRFLPGSVRAELAGQLVTIATTQTDSTITFSTPGINLLSIKSNANQILNIAYAAQVTPDAIRGSGQNIAIATARRADNSQSVKDGPASHRLRIRNGILSDCGTLIGRVFVDKNFDGEQQPGEPGVPNSVIFLDDGNRITTDANGLFSISGVLAGHRTGVLDLTSILGYTLAPNLYVKERNSQSRLVNIAPGALVRMNFAVTPFQGAKQK
ncbi:DUF11 domain-containing protein [Phormidesmis priestleyi]|uniref:DUF11 domain-containing protein n=1 Tax=Phormidesmis priestleyi TaxID=268141 RepID=UPI0009FAFBF5|nr:DUF11 domain-containing protein [Phormidesmis priestleyi]